MGLSKDEIQKLLDDDAKKSRKKGDLAGEVFGCLAAAPEGLTVYQLAKQTDASIDRVRRAIHDARLICGEDDDIFIVAEPQGKGMPWIYRLVGGGTLVKADENLPWTANRIGDAQTRIHTIRMGISTAMRALDKKTKLGHKAVTIERGLRHLEEDLEAIDLYDKSGKS
jgi:hypothetical protein